MSLFDDVTAALRDPRTTTLVMQSELEPGTGPGGVVAPPTYAADKNSTDPTAKFAFTPKAPMPARNEAGWFHDFAQDASGVRHAPRVVVNSLGAEAGACETALYRQQARLGVRLPAFVLGGQPQDDESIETFLSAPKRSKVVQPGLAREQVREALATVVSSWELAHRQADAWLRYAEQDGEQVWKGESETKRVIQSIGLKNGELTYQYAPNSAIYGAWLSSGTPVRQAIPRAYASEITGYGASPVFRAALKLDPTGGASNSSRVQLKSGELSLAAGAGGKEPSKMGFGQVPASSHVAGFTCEVLLRQASVSLKALRRFRYEAEPERSEGQSLAAARVYVLLAMAGHLLSGEDLFLRSGCDLVTVEEQWGWRRHGERAPAALEVPSVEIVAEALQEAVRAAEEAGLRFSDPVHLSRSLPEMELVLDRMVTEAKTETPEDV